MMILISRKKAFIFDKLYKMNSWLKFTFDYYSKPKGKTHLILVSMMKLIPKYTDEIN